MVTTPGRPADRSLPARDILARLTAPPGREQRLTHVEVLGSRPARTAEWPGWVAPEVVSGFRARGVERPWRHQAAAADAAYRGRHVVLATGTSSGKSLAYQAPALSAILQARGRQGQRGATVLYLAPTKALAHDQYAALGLLGVGVRTATHDGDSSREQREWARDHAEYLLTNPDMLHRSMLPGHPRWAPFWARLRFVVVDECHLYRGVFGAHVAHVLRRLRRVAAHHGAEPTFVLASATVAEPAATARRLTGLEVLPVTDDASPRGELVVALWEPPFVSSAGENGAPVRRSAVTETAELLADLVAERVRTLAFVRSRRGAEQVARAAADHLAEADPALAGRVAAYRGGYLPEERRALEESLRAGELTGLAATTALELGIDVQGLDAVLLAGYPGTRAALWQQLGRAGRGAREALGVLVARDDPVDTFLVSHPRVLFGEPVEASVSDPDNVHVLGPHLCAAAAEIPLTEPDLALFGPSAARVVAGLVERRRLRRRPTGWYWTERGHPAESIDIRSVGGPPVSLVESGTGRLVGTVDAARSHATAHPGAVYLHRGETWLVESLDLADQVALIRRASPPYTTTARETTEVRIVAAREQRRWQDCALTFGEVEVTRQVVGFLRRRQPGGEVLGEEPLDLPPRVLRTTAVWWTVPEPRLAALRPSQWAGAAHAAEHCSIGLLPLFATCDRWDVGGVSSVCHPDTGLLTVFVYDGHPGGAGFAERGFATAPRWLAATREAISACGCPDGCPSCVQSPSCGSQNQPLDKAGAQLLLGVLVAASAVGSE